MMTMEDEIRALAEITIIIRKYQEGHITRSEVLTAIASIIRKFKITDYQ